ncbi:carbohydrate ABC transporter permease [Caldanaerobacter subterraneus]|uniref:Carbohydrate ABC transporter membrane protein 1 (CUT1 family) n=2 Tax=Caldanaerobacter subterraneus TaxID=911092 RepID=A0A4R2JPU6_9THEO|nr:sugar ABC transporter permease [Caldanaerobacter subterraneus]KKC30557.1 ABC-type sugar transport system, permease component [Caldanaerobacter subterraneus subsp. pacificus DSM 12653]TCO56185.1 carbohydrate ABC transporter membrane protein 1 (CUT1 family) [Caldanaerobacter subterraneus]
MIKAGKKLSQERRLALIGFLFVLPAVILFIVLVFIPLLQAFYMSLFDWSTIREVKKFIGLKNYIDMFHDPKFIKSVKVTITWTIIVVPSIIFFSLLLALILNLKSLRFKGLFRTIYFIPVVTNMVAAAFVWRWLFEPTNGVINYFLSLLHLPQPGWLADPKWALPAMMIVGVWKQIGFAMVIFLAGLQTIPRDMFEAAYLDGASGVTMLRKITLPLLNPTIVFTSVMLVINAFRVFTIPYVMSAGGFTYGEPGGPLDSTRVFVIHIYDYGFRQFELGYASANAFFLLLVIMVATIIQFKTLERPFEY